MRNRRSFGPVFAAAFAWVADEPPPLARAGHVHVREAVAAGWLVRPVAIHGRWSPGPAWHHDQPGAHQVKPATPNVGGGRHRWRCAGEKSRETLEPMRIERPNAAHLARRRASARQAERDVYRRNPVVHHNTPPAERAPPGTTD